MKKIQIPDSDWEWSFVIFISIITAATVFSGLAVINFSPTYEYQITDVEESNMELKSIEHINDMNSEQKEIIQTLNKEKNIQTNSNKFNVSDGNIIVINDNDYTGIHIDSEDNLWSVIFFILILFNLGVVLLIKNESDAHTLMSMLSFVVVMGVIIYVTRVNLL